MDQRSPPRAPDRFAPYNAERQSPYSPTFARRIALLAALACSALLALISPVAEGAKPAKKASAAKQAPTPRSVGKAGQAQRAAAAGDVSGKKPRVPRIAPDLRSAQILKFDQSELGTTLSIRLKNGMFPCPGKPYDDDTTIVFIPKYFRQTGHVDLLVHFHGHHGLAAQKMLDHDLREQFHEAGRNALLVMPQGPQNATDSSGGKLERPGMYRKFLYEIMAVLKSNAATTALGSAKISGNARLGLTAISSHSGGYKVTARIIAHGGYPVQEIYLFDSLYGNVDAYANWLHRKGTKLISWYVVDTPARLNRELMARLRQAKIRWIHEEVEGTLSRWQLMNGRAVFIHTDIQHGRTPYKHHNLREALLASGFRKARGAPATDWYKSVKGPRPVIERKP
jgi:hypothetical protein